MIARAWWRRHPDAAIAIALAAVLVLLSLMYLPGHAALQAWRNLNNPILYADRYADPQLFPNDRIISHLRDIYPFLSIVYWLPAVLLKFAGIPPQVISFATVALNDALIAAAVYFLARALGQPRESSVVAGLFVLASKVLSWDLSGYEYYGHDFAYSGSFYLPFAIGVIPCVIAGWMRTAIVLAAMASLIFAPAGALMCGVIVCVMFARRGREAWSRPAPWFVLPLLVFAWTAYIQFSINARITERFTPEQDLEAVMVNGHLVPYWLHGQFFASTYLGFIFWCGLAALAVRQWRALSFDQRLPLQLLVAFNVVGAVVGFVAVQLGLPAILRLGPFRYFLLLGISLVPLVVGELLERMRQGDYVTRAVVMLLFVLLAVDRGTAWMLPLLLPCTLFVAFRPSLDSLSRWLAPLAAGILMLASLDVLLRGGILPSIAAALDPTARIAPVMTEASRRLSAAAPELLLIPLALVAALIAAKRATREHMLVRALGIFLFACLVMRTSTNAAWAASGPPMRLAEAELWAKASTPVAAKFIFVEAESGGSYPSWQTLSQRGAAEMQYTHQKVYLPDRELLEIDKAVSANYGFDPATVEGKVYPFYAFDLLERYLKFTTADFLRAGRLSGSNYAVVKKPRALEFPIAFENSDYRIYRLPAQFGDVTLTAVRIDARSITIAWDAADETRPEYVADVEFRDPSGQRTNLMHCCVRIGSAAGTHTFSLPDGHSGRYLALVGVADAVTRARRPLLGDGTGENRAFWEYLVD